MELKHGATADQVFELMRIFGKTSYENGQPCIEVPEWLEVMFNHCEAKSGKHLRVSSCL